MSRCRPTTWRVAKIISPRWPRYSGSAEFLGGPTRLVVAGSGHIAGVINPPAQQKYQHWTNDQEAATEDEWMAGASEHAGSWWPDWAAWIGKHSGKQVEARSMGEDR